MAYILGVIHARENFTDSVIMFSACLTLLLSAIRV